MALATMHYERDLTPHGLITQLFMPGIDTSRISDSDVRKAVERGYHRAKTRYPRIHGERDDRTVPVTIDRNPVTPEGIHYRGVTELGQEYHKGRRRHRPRRVGISPYQPVKKIEEVTEHELLHAKIMDNDVDISEYADMGLRMNHIVQESFTEYTRVDRALKEKNYEEAQRILNESPYPQAIRFGAIVDRFYKGKNGKGYYAFINDMIELRSTRAAVEQLKASIREAYRNGEIKHNLN